MKTTDRERGAEAATVGRMCRGQNDVLAHGDTNIGNVMQSESQANEPARALEKRSGLQLGRPTGRHKSPRPARMARVAACGHVLQQLHEASAITIRIISSKGIYWQFNIPMGYENQRRPWALQGQHKHIAHRSFCAAVPEQPGGLAVQALAGAAHISLRGRSAPTAGSRSMRRINLPLSAAGSPLGR